MAQKSWLNASAPASFTTKQKVNSVHDDADHLFIVESQDTVFRVCTHMLLNFYGHFIVDILQASKLEYPMHIVCVSNEHISQKANVSPTAELFC